VERPEITGDRTLIKGWDPVENREVWRFPSQGGNGGSMSSGGGLVFWGTGDRMVALDARGGALLWEAQVGLGTATPVTYELDGRQYVTIMGGSGGQFPPRVWTFALPR
jgi:quinohemoprotein ethanol dehydrogenase